MKTSILVPTVGRPDEMQVRRLVDRLLETTAENDVEVLVAIDGDKPSVAKTLEGSGARVLSERKVNHGSVYTWNEAARSATGDALAIIGDDCWPEMNWLDRALDELAGSVGMVGFNDQDPTPGDRDTPPHFLMTRQHIIETQGGCLMVPHYRAFYSDLESHARAVAAGQYQYAARSLVKHNAFYGVGNPRSTDAVYLRSRGLQGLDTETYNWRESRGFPNDFPAQIGPNRPTGPSVFWSQLKITQGLSARRALEIAEYCAVKGYYQINMPDARTDLTRSRLERRFRRLSTHPDDVLVMLDGDHIHPHDIVETLSAQTPDVVGARYILRGSDKYAMFKRVDGRLQAINKFPEGDLIKVDAIGTGAIAIKRRAFEALEAKTYYAPFFRYGYMDQDEYMPSEDMYFSRMCEAAGIKMACHTGVYTAHVVEKLI